MYYVIKKIGKEFKIELVRTVDVSGSSRFSIDLKFTTENLLQLAAMTKKLENKVGFSINYGYNLYLEGYTISRKFLIDVMGLLDYYPQINYRVFFQKSFYDSWKEFPTIFDFLYKENGNVSLFSEQVINTTIEHWSKLYRTKSHFYLNEVVQLLKLLHLANSYHQSYRWFVNRLYEYDFKMFMHFENHYMFNLFKNLEKEEVKNPKKIFFRFLKLLSNYNSDPKTYQIFLSFFAKFCKKPDIITCYIEKLFLLIKTLPNNEFRRNILLKTFTDISEQPENSEKHETFFKFIELITPLIHEDDNTGNEKLDEIINFTKPFWQKASFKLINTNDLYSRILYYLLPNYIFPNFFIFNFFQISEKDKKLFKFIVEGNNMSAFEDLPFEITKKQAHYFINYDLLNFQITIPHSVSYYLVCAKCIDFKMPNDLIYNILQRSNLVQNINRLNTLFIDNVLLFFSRNKDYIDQRDIQTFLDFFYYKFQQDQDDFYLLNRSIWSVLNNIVQWHDEINSSKIQGNRVWKGIKMNDFKFTYKEEEYEIVQITKEIDLVNEGKELRHCVYTYLHDCISGKCSIWSMRKKIDEKNYERILTIEVINNRIKQIKGFSNRNHTAEEGKIIYSWIGKAKLGTN